MLRTWHCFESGAQSFFLPDNLAWDFLPRGSQALIAQPSLVKGKKMDNCFNCKLIKSDYHRELEVPSSPALPLTV